MSPKDLTPIPKAPGRHLPGEAGIWILVFGDMVMFSIFFTVFALAQSQEMQVFTQARTLLNPWLDVYKRQSGGNLQPWHLHILGGEPLQNFKTLMQQRLDDKTLREEPEYHVYPPHLVPPYTDRRFAVGEALYARLGIPREDKLARRAWFARNFAFFGAPLALFCTVDRLMGPPQWSDLGMLLQTIMLLLRAEGLDSCAQECWALYPRTISEFLNLPPERMLFCGMSCLLYTSRCV